MGVYLHQLYTSLPNSCNSVKLNGEHLWTVIIKSCDRSSYIFRSGFWLVHSNTLIFFDLNYSLLAPAIYLGVLSCWKMNLHSSLKSFADCKWFTLIVFGSIHLPIIADQLPCHWWRKASPYSMMLSPPCFTVLWWYGWSVRFLLHVALAKTFKGTFFFHMFAVFHMACGKLQTWLIAFFQQAFFLPVLHKIQIWGVHD